MTHEEERMVVDAVAAKASPYGTDWHLHTSSMKDTAREAARKLLAPLLDALTAARRERDEALAKYQFMVDRAANEKLDGYRELAARAADAENRRDEALARQRDTHNRLCIVEMALAANRARTGQETNARIEAMRRRMEEAMRERDEAEQRGRDAERRRVRAAVEQMMADAVHEVSDLRVMMRERGKTETTYADFTRNQGKIDACERVLQVLDAHVGAGKGET